MYKADQILDILLKDKQLKLSDDHKLLKAHEIKDRKYCKFHNTFSHVTNDCIHFRDIIQRGLTEGRLKFSDKKPDMKVDTEPFGAEVSKVDHKTPLGVGMVNIRAGQKFEMELSDSYDIYPKPGERLAEFANRKKENGRLKICPCCEMFYDDLAAQKAKAQKTPSYHPMERNESFENRGRFS